MVILNLCRQGTYVRITRQLLSFCSVISAASFKLLEKPNHSYRPEMSDECPNTSFPNFFQCFFLFSHLEFPLEATVIIIPDSFVQLKFRRGEEANLQRSCLFLISSQSIAWISPRL